MKNHNSRKQNRIFIMLNYLSLISVIIVFYVVKYFQFTIPLIVLEIGLIAMFIITFLRTYIKTGKLKIIHTSSKNLDERERDVVLKALKIAYSIFTIACLLIIYVFAIFKLHPFDVLLAGGLLYLAHTLPAAIIGWNERIIPMDDE